MQQDLTRVSLLYALRDDRAGNSPGAEEGSSLQTPWLSKPPVKSSRPPGSALVVVCSIAKCLRPQFERLCAAWRSTIDAAEGHSPSRCEVFQWMHASNAGLHGLKLASRSMPTGCPLVKYLNRRNVEHLALVRRTASDLTDDINVL